MAEELNSISLGEFDTISTLIVSEISLQISLIILFVGLAILAVSYFKFSSWVHKQNFYYARPHLSRFTIEAMLPIFAIVLVSAVSFYVYSSDIFGVEYTNTTNSEISTSSRETFAKILNTINILVIGFTTARLIPIILTKHEKSKLEVKDFEDWKAIHGFSDDQCYRCSYCEGEKYGLCDNPPKFFQKLFQWYPPVEPPENFPKEKFEECLKTKEGRLFLENYYTEDGQSIGNYQGIVKNPFEEWKQNERKKYQKYLNACITGKNPSGTKLFLGKSPEEIFPIDEWREHRRLKGYSIVKPGSTNVGKKVPKAIQQIVSLLIFAVTVLGVADGGV